MEGYKKRLIAYKKSDSLEVLWPFKFAFLFLMNILKSKSSKISVAIAT